MINLLEKTWKVCGGVKILEDNLNSSNEKLSTEITDLQNKVNEKISKFYASNQGETNLADSDNGKIIDMKLYGKSEQKQYTGNNLLNYSNIYPIENVDSIIKRTVSEDGLITSSITDDSRNWEYNNAEYRAELEAGTYTLSIDVKTESNSDYGDVEIHSANGKILGFDGTVFKKALVGLVYKTFTLNAKTKIGVMCKPYNASFTIQLEKGSSPTSFEPYTGGIPSPNPDYPQEIKSVINPTVKICGKNLIANVIPGQSTSEVSGFYNNIGTVWNEVNSLTLIINKPLEANRNYKISFVAKSGTTTAIIYVLLVYDDSTYSVIYEDVNTSETSISLIINSRKRIKKLRIGKNENIKDMLIKKGTIQLEEGSTVTSYEPYKDQTITLPYTLNAIPVTSGGNVTIDGQQYISDYIDVEHGKLIRNTRVIDFADASYGPYAANDLVDSREVRFAHSKLKIKPKPYNKCDGFISSMYNVPSTWNIDKVGIWSNGQAEDESQLAIRVPINKYYIDYFNEIGGCKGLFEIDTPEEIDLTSEQIQAFRQLSTYYPVTNVYIASEQLDGYTVFNYPVSMAQGWNYVKKQLNDNRDYIYDIDEQTQNIDTQSAEAYVNSEYAVALTELEV